MTNGGDELEKLSPVPGNLERFHSVEMASYSIAPLGGSSHLVSGL
jgi:hypothetical protein